MAAESPSSGVTLIDRAVSLIRKAELKNVPRQKIKSFLKRKKLTADQITQAFEKYVMVENLVECDFLQRPLGFSVVMDAMGKNAVVSSIQQESLKKNGLTKGSRLMKINDLHVEHMKHQDIIDIILDHKCPFTMTFRKRKHPKRGSLFHKVDRPTRSIPAQKSSRESIIVNKNKKQRNSGSKPKLFKAVGSRGSQVVQRGKYSSSSNLIHANNIQTFEDTKLDQQKAEYMQALAAMTANLAKSGSFEQDKNLSHLSKRTKELLSAKASGKEEELAEGDEFFGQMVGLWKAEKSGSGRRSRHDHERSSEISTQKFYVREAKKQILGSEFEIKGRSRALSTPVYSTDALSEMRKGCSLLKYGSKLASKPKFRYFQLSKNNAELIWFSDKKKSEDSRILISDIVEIRQNEQHEKKQKEEFVTSNSFTIIYRDGQQLRLTAKNDTESYIWTSGLAYLHEKAQKNVPLNTITHIEIDKRPGLDLHRRQSLANLLEKKTAGGIHKQQTKEKLTVELKRVTKKHKELVELAGSPSLAKKELEEEMSSSMEILEDLNNRLKSIEGQLEDPDFFDPDIIKTDTWNISIDLVALRCKLNVLAAQPVAL